jgi:Mg2+/Co2+ transporter CorC
LYYTWPLWRAVGLLMAPLVWGARFVDTVFHRVAGRMPEVPDEESFEDEIRTIVTEGHREGLLEEDAREMIEGVIELGDVVVSEIMTPRTDMVSMPLSLSWQEMLQFVVRVRHTRIPVHENNRDDIIGILYTKDLLPELAKGPDEPRTPWKSLLRAPWFVPETKPVDDLLQEFQQTRNHMVVVLDEYGGVSGLVTMEDVLEEIVGEIIDESDKDLVDGIREIDHRTAEALGKVHIDEINERLALDLPDDGEPPEAQAERDAAIAAAAKELNDLRENWLNPPEWTRSEVLEFPGTVGGPWHRYIDPATVTDRGALKVGTVRYPRLVARDADCAARLKERTLTKLYNERPPWLADCHARLDAAVAAAYGWPADLPDEAILERLLSLNQAATA